MSSKEGKKKNESSLLGTAFRWTITLVFTAIFTLVTVFGVLYYRANGEMHILYKDIVFGQWNRFNADVMCVQNPDGKAYKFGNLDLYKECDVSLKVNNWLFYEKIVLGGNVGMGESYMDGHWTVADNTDIADLLYHMGYNTFRNPGIFFKILSLFVTPAAAGNGLKSFMYGFERFAETKTMDKDKNDIKYIYSDIDTDFYQLFMDETLLYTCAIFNTPKDTLFNAQTNKMNALIQKLDLKKGMTVLDIGSGWGYFASYIANHTGANVVGITLSQQQYDYSLENWIPYSKNLEFKLMDYRHLRNLTTKFDRIVSVGMIEHVHYIRLKEYMSIAYDMLKPGGRFVLHGIVTKDAYPQTFPVYRSNACQGSNFVSKYIFPGGCLLHPDWIHENGLNTGFQTIHQELFGAHYVQTLKEWRNFLNANQTKNLNPKYDDRLFKQFEFYLAVSERGFRLERISLLQSIFIKPKYTDNNHAKVKYDPKFKVQHGSEYVVTPYDLSHYAYEN